MSVRLLLDTHTFLWLASGDPRMSKRALELASDPANSLWLSTASVWEIAMKASLGKLDLEMSVEDLIAGQLVAMSVQTLVIQVRHAVAVSDLPFHHRDPFDRLLVVQAQVEALGLLSRDTIFDEYFQDRIW